jgi:hypothetical protein
VEASVRRIRRIQSCKITGLTADVGDQMKFHVYEEVPINKSKLSIIKT